MKIIKNKLIFAFLIFLVSVTLILQGCSTDNNENNENTKQGEEEIMYNRISAVEAKEIIDNQDEVIIVDVRTREEFVQGYIEEAVLLPLDLIPFKASDTLPDKDAKILIYCRSGNRSAFAAKTLVNMGYTDINDFGGILDWPYDIVK